VYLFIIRTEINLTNYKSIISKTIDGGNLSICFGNGNSGTMEELRTCFKRELDSQNNATSGEGSRKRRKYLYFDQLLFLLHYTEDRETQSNLNSLNDEEEANISQEEEKERPRKVRKVEANRNYLRGISATEKKKKKNGRYGCR
jgi:hypothetical protein